MNRLLWIILIQIKYTSLSVTADISSSSPPLILVGDGDVSQISTTDSNKTTTVFYETTTTEEPPPEYENEEAKIEQTPWLKFSELVFRKVDRLPSEALSLHGVKCDPDLWKTYSPVHTMAFPPHGTDKARNTNETLRRHDRIQLFRQKPVGGLKTPHLNDVWQHLLKDPGQAEESVLAEKIHVGRSLEQALCYSDGNELLECNSKERCSCPAVGNLAKLRMVRIKKSQIISEAACMGMDCGYCLMKSTATCGLYGVCREAAVTREWPFTHLNGSCRDSELNLNSQPARDSGSLQMSDSLMLVSILILQLLYYCNLKAFK